jgi:quercetin dioxygenase-like cupin family protein
MDTTTALPLHRKADEGDAVWAMGSLFEMKLRAAESGGELSIMLVTQPPGIATPLHVHSNESEVFFLLDGEMTYDAGGTVHELTAGSTMWLPKGVPHRFRVHGTTPARFLGLAVPGGIDEMYDFVGRPAAERRIPDEYPPEEEIGRWVEIGPRRGMQVLGPPLPE